jgi:hypothetical protein
MPGASSVELSEAFDVIKRYSRPVENLVVSVDGFYFGEMEHRVEQHRCVTIRQNEPITV